MTYYFEGNTAKEDNILYFCSASPFLKHAHSLVSLALHTKLRIAINILVFFTMIIHPCISLDYHNQEEKYCCAQFTKKETEGYKARI